MTNKNTSKMNERFQIIHLGNPYDFIVKDHHSKQTYGTFQGDTDSLLNCLNSLDKENKELEAVNNELHEENQKLRELLFDPRRLTEEVEE